jgi:hypothetical protein
MLAAALGFCGRHSRDLLSFGGQCLAAAVVERASLLAAIQALPDLVASTPPAASSWSRLWQSRQAVAETEDARMPPGIKQCPACVRQANEEDRGTVILLAHLDEFSGPLLAAGGLCLPHLGQAVRAANPHGRDALLTIQQRVWGELAQDLEEFIRVHNQYHHADPISERGRHALERTIAALTGEFPVR